MQGSAAFLCLAALALAGERVEFYDNLSESQQAVVVFGFITFAFLVRATGSSLFPPSLLLWTTATRL